MACNYSDRIGEQYAGGGGLKKYGLKESFNDRLAASFQADYQISRWRFGLLFANATLLAEPVPGLRVDKIHSATFAINEFVVVTSMNEYEVSEKMVVSVGLGVLAHYLRRVWRHHEPFLASYSGAPCLALQGTAGLMCVCALFSVVPVSLRRRALHIAYELCLCSAMLLQLGLLLYWVLQAGAAARDAVGENFRKGLHEYETDTFMRERVDVVQKNLLCCGVDEIEDWFETETNAIPYSCCWLRPSGGEHNCLNVDMLYVQTDSCLPKLQQIPSTGTIVIYAITGSLIAIQVTALMLSCRVGQLLRQHARERAKPWAS